MQRTDFVTGWVPQVRKIELARCSFAPAWRVLDALAPIGNAGVVESLDLLGVGARESNCSTVGVCRRLTINRLRDAEHASLRSINNAPFRIGLPPRDANGTQHSVIEFLGRREIVSADHYV